MFSLTRDEQLFKQFYDDEQTYPRHFREASSNWGVTLEEFQSFCGKCERIYELGRTTLVYTERIGHNANLHFSILRGSDINLDSLRGVRDALLTDYDMLFAYVAKHNRGLRKMVEQLDLVHNGIEMRCGATYGKVVVWQLFTVSRNSLKNKGFDSIIIST